MTRKIIFIFLLLFSAKSRAQLGDNDFTLRIDGVPGIHSWLYESDQSTYGSDSSDYVFSDDIGTIYRNMSYENISEDTSRYYHSGELNLMLVYNKSTHVAKSIDFYYSDQITSCGNTYFFRIENVALTETATELQGQLVGKNILGHNFQVKHSTCMPNGRLEVRRDNYRDTGITNASLISFSISKKDIMQSDVFAHTPALSLDISPNPTTGIITIHASENFQHATISNILGQSVIDVTHPNAPNFKVDLSKLPQGTYYARFSLPGQVITRKIVKE